MILEGLSSEKEQLEQSSKEEIDLKKRVEHFRKVLEKNEVLTVFNRCVFESIVEKVIVSEISENENANSYKLIFVYKTEYFNTVQSKMHKQTKKRELKMKW